ncbi:MAG: tyrosine-protein phosphatase [Clostridia bacterium]|nr:tyrosine-protein phosphatase [Clostridia bacterium]
MLRKPTQTIAIDGAVNARDIGGYKGLNGKRVKRGIIYRGAHLDGITDKDNALAIIGYFEKVIDYIEAFTGRDLREKTEEFLKQSGMTEEQIVAIRNNVLE